MNVWLKGKLMMYVNVITPGANPTSAIGGDPLWAQKTWVELI